MQNFCHSYFFGEIWSQNLKFSKLTEIRDKHTFLYACYNVNVYFPKIFVTHIFFGKSGPIIWSPIKWLKFCIGVNCYMPTITILIFIFSKFLSVIFFGQIWSQNLMFSKLTEILLYADVILTGHIVICWFWFWCVIFQSIGHSQILGANFIPKSVFLHIYSNLA